MSPNQMFSLCNGAAVVAWILLAVAPRHRWVALITRIVPVLFALLYVAIIAAAWGGRGPGGFSSLTEVGMLFSRPWLLLAGWVHYLAFDLLVGIWETRDARERGIPHLAVVPCLFLTFMFGPAGWLAYLCVRVANGRGRRARAT